MFLQSSIIIVPLGNGTWISTTTATHKRGDLISSEMFRAVKADAKPRI